MAVVIEPEEWNKKQHLHTWEKGSEEKAMLLKKKGKVVGFKSSEMWHSVVVWVIASESKESNISLQVPSSSYTDLSLKIQPESLKTSEANHPMTQRHTPEYINL